MRNSKWERTRLKDSLDDDDDDDDTDIRKKLNKQNLETSTHKKLFQPPSLRDELPAMALLTLLYAIQGIPLGLTMGSV